MKKQFCPVNSRYGAPMGRSSYGVPEQCAPKSIRVFKVNLDSGGYDDGGAYWGHGDALYCATDDADYRDFTRAKSRARAVAAFKIEPAYLARGISSHIAKMRETMREYIAAGLPYIGADTVKKLTELGY